MDETEGGLYWLEACDPNAPATLENVLAAMTKTRGLPLEGLPRISTERGVLAVSPFTLNTPHVHPQGQSIAQVESLRRALGLIEQTGRRRSVWRQLTALLAATLTLAGVILGVQGPLFHSFLVANVGAALLAVLCGFPVVRKI